MIYLIIIIIIFVNRVLTNENYSKIINVGYFYHLFCKDVEFSLFQKTFDGILDKKINVLDFGCGPGIMCEYFDNYTGIDIDETRINYAKKIYPDKHFLLVNEGEQLPFEDKKFECILFNDCLHHISDYNISKIMVDLHRIIKDDGIIVIREPKRDTNFLTYLITEIFENGDYVRSSNEYKRFFEDSFDIVYEKSSNHFVRDYYVLIVKNNNKYNKKHIKYDNNCRIERIIINLFTIFLVFFMIHKIDQNFNNVT